MAKKKRYKSKKNVVAEENTVIRTGDHEYLKSTDGITNACFIVIHGPNLGKKFNLEPGVFTVGRTETSDIRINEENISRRHAEIQVAARRTTITDLESTNGIFINTKRQKSATLKDGDLVLIGNTILKFISSSNIENAYHEEIYKLATLDGLTHAYNKKYIVDRISMEYSRSHRYGRELSLILFDFDHFKSLNDTYGHLAGDFVLKKSASHIIQNLRKEDVLGRYGGEEFAVVLPETSLEEAFQIAEKIRILIEEVEFKFNDLRLPVTISVGVASYKKDPGIKNYNDLIELADMSLYEAKNHGRNTTMARQLN